MPSVRLESVTKRFGGTMAADGLDLEVKDGEYLCLLGPTGAGKTTALRMVAGLTRPDSGRILFDGNDVTSLEPEERRAVLLSQTYSLFPTMSVADNIMFSPSVRRAPEDEMSRTLPPLLDMMRLTRRSASFPRELSGGMQQRTALARALASSPDVLLLDEPLRALDARLRIDLRKDLRSLAKEVGLTVVHVTHDQEEAMVMADRIAVIRKGSIVQVGTPREIHDEPGTPFVANFVGQSNLFVGAVARSDAEMTVVDSRGIGIPARPSSLKVGEAAMAAVKVAGTRVVKERDAFVTGIVERVMFEGRLVHLDVRTELLGPVSAKLPASRRDQVSEGDEVGLRWDLRSSTAFSCPDGRLDDDLRVD